MKQQGTLALFLFCSVVECGAAASATARSRKALQPHRGELAEADEEPMLGSALLDLSQSEAVERKVLLSKLSKVESLTGAERQALRAQQQVLIALEQEQETLESRVTALETAERAVSSAGLVVEKGTVSNTAWQTPIVRQKKQAFEIVDGRKDRVVVPAGSVSKKDANRLVILMHDTEKDFWQKYNKAFWEKMGGIACYLVQIFLVAFLYTQFCKHTTTIKIAEGQTRTDEFQYGVFDSSDILKDCQMCVCACCCPWIRWADSASAPHIQFLAFLPGLFITALLASASAVTFGTSLPILLLIVVLSRQRIREVYGLPAGTITILCGDCLLWICCPCCAIVQEARQVEYVEVPMLEYGP